MTRSKKIVIIGAGVVGSVIAREMAEKGFDVDIYERRNHVGGNLFDYIDEFGIRVHKYGPHIFHTNIERVWTYVNKYCSFNDFNLVCGSVIDGKCVPTSFDYQAVDTFFPDEAETIKLHIKECYGDRQSATILEMLSSDDEYVKKFADFLYEKDYAPYTAKQWGISPEEVDREIFKRVPVLFSYDSKYFADKYQAMPVNGYVELIENLLNNPRINVHLEKDILCNKIINDRKILFDNLSEDIHVVYTGPLDELFDCCYGELPYRSLRFEWKHEGVSSIQEMPVVAYPQEPYYTRITEYKKLPNQDVEGTTYAVEYPLPYRKGEKNEPYYPVVTSDSSVLFGQYEALANSVDNLSICGRLAEFKYYNIDLAIDRALDVAEKLGEQLIDRL